MSCRSSRVAYLHASPLVTLASLLLLAAAPIVLGQANLRHMVNFGDSLTHNTILWAYYGTWRDLYGDDPLEAAWKQGAVRGDELTSYAVAGSESDQLLWQIDTFMFFEFLGIENRPTIVGFEIGGNNIMNNIDLLKRYPPGQNRNADAIINNLLADIEEGMWALRQEYRCQFILWNVPDVTVTPDLYNVLNAVERANVRAHMERANALIEAQAARADLAFVDVYTMLQDFVSSPPVIYGRPLIGPPAKGDYDHIFADEIHPTRVANLILANEIIDRVNATYNDDIPLYTEDELAAAARFK